MKKKLGIGFKTAIATMLILVGVSGIALFFGLCIGEMEKELLVIKNQQMHAMSSALELSGEIHSMQLALERYVAGDYQQTYIYEKHRGNLENYLRYFEQLEDNNREDIEKIRTYFSQYHERAEQLFESYKPEDKRSANEQMMILMDKEGAALEGMLTTLKERLYERAQSEYQNQRMRQQHLPKLQTIMGLLEHARGAKGDLRAFVSGDPEAIKTFEEKLQKIEAAYDELLESATGEDIEMLESIGDTYNALKQQAQQAFGQYDPLAEVRAEREVAALYKDYYTEIDKLASTIAYRTKTVVIEALDRELRIIRFIYTALIVSVVVVAFLAGISGIIVHRIVIKPIVNLSQMMQAIGEGEGDLTTRLPVKSKDEIGVLTYYFNQFVAKIHGMVEGIVEDTQQLFETSGTIETIIYESEKGMQTIGSTIEAMTCSLQENASTVEETTASIEEIASSSAVVSEDAEGVATASQHVLRVAQEGGQKLHHVKASYEKIKEASQGISFHITGLVEDSKQIEGVLALITGIAEQVNLLALNASIEAARVGEYGLGFAVVADEIRKLAEESRQSATQIGNLLEHIAQKTDQAAQAAQNEQDYIVESDSTLNETEVAFNHILDAARQMTSQASHIAEVVQNQAQATEEMSQAINEISVATQENAESVTHINNQGELQISQLESLTNYMTSFTKLFEDLVEETNRFKI